MTHPFPILLAEDSETNILITSRLLESHNYQVTVSRDGLEAIQAYKDFIKNTGQPFSIILMDCHMPSMDGGSAAKEIRKIEKQNNLPPSIIIALTGNTEEPDLEKCQVFGMNDFIVKPFKKEAFFQKLDSYRNDSTRSSNSNN